MEQDRPGVACGVLGGLLVGMLCCLCLAGATASAALIVGMPAETMSAGDRAPAPETEPAPHFPGEVGGSGEEANLASARQMQRLLRAVAVPVADPMSLAQRLQGVSGVPDSVAGGADPVPLGSIRTFWASQVEENEYFQVRARLAYATEHVYFWVEEGVKVDEASLRNLVDRFETETYPTNRAFFGTEWTPGVDGDPHLYILYARGLGPSIAGYYSPNDEYLPEVHEYSNAHEMFYLNVDTTDLEESFTEGVLAHEFQHMIHWHLDRNEETWMNEGFSELAALLNGYDIGGADRAFAADPDRPLTYWPPEPGSGAPYGQAFLLLAYFLDRFGPEATQALVADPANGLDSIDRALTALGAKDPATGAAVDADDVVRDWAVALLLQDPALGDGRYGLRTPPRVPSVAYADSFRGCPVEEQRRHVNQYGVDYIRVRCAGTYKLVFEGDRLVPVVPSDPHSGEFAFWSNRGDHSDMTLTRAFDLTKAEGPVTLDYWLWYDLEEGYDYVYLEVSEDGGSTWTILTTPSGTAEDPSGNAYGWAYNGLSGGGISPVWIQESVDLGAYRGKDILVRFEYVTDAAVNGEGLLLDDVSIDALGYREDFEDGKGGWSAEGFVRLYNRLPQRYRVVLVTRGREDTVRELDLGPENRGQVPLVLGDGTEEAVLVVIGTARHTWQPASYRFAIEP